MTTHSVYPMAVLALVLGATALARADNPPAGTDAAGDPLPKGAKFRLGNGRLIFGAPRQSRHPFVLLGPDYKALAHVDKAGVLRRFDPVTGARLNTVPDEPAATRPEATHVAVSADGRRVATVGFRTGTIALRDAATGELIREVKYPAGAFADPSSGVPILSLSADGKVLAAGGHLKLGKFETSVWDMETGEVVFRHETLPDDPAAVALSPDGKLLATHGWDSGPIPNKSERRRVIQVWDVAGKKFLFRAKPTDGPYAVMAFSPDGAVLAFSGGDGIIDLWNAKTGRPREPLLGRTGQGSRLAFSPDSKTLAAISSAGTIQRWTVANQKHLGATEPPVGVDVPFFAQGIVFADAERVLGWGRVGASPFVWEAPAGKPITRLPEHTGSIWSVAFAARGKELLTHAADGRLLRWDTASGRLLGPVALRLPRGAVTADGLAFSPDGARVATLGRAPAMFDAATGSEEFALPPQTLFSPSPDLKRGCVIGTPAQGGATTRCAVWDLVERQKIAEVELPVVGGRMPQAVLGPSGHRLVSVTYSPSIGSGKNTATLTGWDLKTETKLGLVTDEVAGTGLDVTVADDTLALVRHPNGRLRVLDYETGKFGAEFEPEPKKLDRSVYGPVVFSANRKRVAAGLPLGEGAWPHGVRVYEWPTGKPMHTFIGHTGRITAIAFSPDGGMLATGSADGTVLVWDLTTGK